ncbi:selina-4(15),7(11)-diene synthase [Embleya sp. NBC_00896]|uniref:selina-4(15),7(11)-diene synthase n=1 Tax=Embleya sp. NBC_00896 TaxID=2975961 RepID=UPI002F91BDB5|nr:terpene synthase [Embleya sp. NBC_00896]
MTQRLAVPPIYSPFQPAIHARYAAIDKQTAEWADKFRIGSEELRAKLVTQEIGTFAARILPDGQEEAIGIMADFVLWLFGVDDGYCEEGSLGTDPGGLVAVLSRLTRIAQNPEAPMMVDDPLAMGLRDLRRRISVHATPVQTARWVDALREYFMSVVWEASHRRLGTVPDLNDYTLMRLYDGATSVVPPMMEFAYGYELPPNERDDLRVRALAEMAYFLITWDNDIFSYHKESRAGQYYLNVLRVLEHHDNLTPEEALPTVIAQRDRVTCLFLRVREQLFTTAGADLRQYVDSLAAFIRASQDWGVSSHRYTTPDDPANLPAAFHDTPSDSSTAPLPIPCIAWWWDLLPG